MKNVIKSALIVATVALSATAATAASAASTQLLPVERFVVSNENRANFDANLATLGIALRPGEVLTGEERDDAVRIMNSGIYDETKTQLIRALYADDEAVIQSNGLY
ncbi:hypothetical protein [Loktanella sp. DSM 29012]|uniref:hypothetical protein n=1 Tax=Loktanella sp. DSM 29012 TaxID=1881056 RepID=UPI00115FE6E4|nr:hypothetical protein [Loktanella sp. DSM 29012]